MFNLNKKMDNYSSDEDNEITLQERYYLPLVQNYKKIHDSIHGYISVSNYACRIIDCKYFQQLRNKKQCSGFCFTNLF